jgi:hypothetical protein
MTAQRRVILTQPPVCFLGVSQDGCGIGKQPASGLRHAHPMRIPPQQRRATQFLQRLQLSAQCGLRNPQTPRASGNAAALNDANKGAEQRQIFKGSHANPA